jgi:hypothetical protein
VHGGFWWGNMGKRDHLENPDMDGRIILELIFKTCDVGMDWIALAQNRDRWWAYVNVLMNLRVPVYAGNVLTRWRPG